MRNGFDVLECVVLLAGCVFPFVQLYRIKPHLTKALLLTLLTIAAGTALASFAVFRSMQKAYSAEYDGLILLLFILITEFVLTVQFTLQYLRTNRLLRTRKCTAGTVKKVISYSSNPAKPVYHLHVQYTVNQKTYTNTAAVTNDAKYKAGDRVPVYYAAKHPRISYTAADRSFPKRNTLYLACLLTFGVSFCMLIAEMFLCVRMISLCIPDLAVTGLAAAVLANYVEESRVHRLSHSTRGTVVRAEKGILLAEFELDGVRYTTGYRKVRTNDDAADLREGDTVPVLYDADAPARAVMQGDESRYRRAKQLLLLLPVILAYFVLTRIL